MSLNQSIYFDDQQLMVDGILVSDIIQAVGTPTYLYSQQRILDNYHAIEAAFSALDCHIHYSVKANGNLHILATLIQAGAGIDCVSGGEIFRARQAGAHGRQIVFAGVGKTASEIQFALENEVAWFNVENVYELDIINDLAQGLGLASVQIALRFNPQVTANTHPHIATGHGGAKFGLTATVIQDILRDTSRWQALTFCGLHVHIGSQLHDTDATVDALTAARELIRPYHEINTLNIGGGFPAHYDDKTQLPSMQAFAQAIRPLIEDYHLIIEPGRSIVADAGILATQILYVKEQAGQRFYIVDGSMTELIRPMLYQAQHQIVALKCMSPDTHVVQVVGPVCETTDILGRDVSLAEMKRGDYLAILTTGAYGTVMASNYNARPKPAEVMVTTSGTWQFIRRRETWDDLINQER